MGNGDDGAGRGCLFYVTPLLGWCHFFFRDLGALP